MAHIIMRAEKLKAKTNIAGAAAHIERLMVVPNADPKLTASNRWLIGGPGMYRAAVTAIDGLEKTTRKDAVHGIEVLLTASPEAFKAGGEKFREEFARRSVAWLKKEFEKRGAIIVGAQLQLDEATPHIHAIIVPTTRDKDGKLGLACKEYLGGSAKLQKLQDSVAKEFASLGLERGLKGSKATHVTMKEMATMAQATEVPRVELTSPKTVTIKDGLLSSHSEVVYVRDELRAKLTDSLKPISAMARAGTLHARQAEDLKRSNAKVSARADRLQKDRDALAEENRRLASQLREIPMERVMEAYGCTRDPSDKAKWQTPAGPISITGKKFFNHVETKGGGGAIDLVMHLEECDYGTAMASMARTFGQGAVIAQIAAQAAQRAAKELAEVKPQPFVTPSHEDRHWPRVRRYLVEVRKLAETLVDRLRNTGWLGADRRANAWFLNIDPKTGKATGTDLRGTGESAFKGCGAGSDAIAGVFVVEGGTKQLLVAESAIDAISLAELYPDATVISTGGTGKHEAAQRYIDRHGHRFTKIVCASDHGHGGALLAKNLNLPHLPPPAGKDWNEHLADLKKADKKSADLHSTLSLSK